MDTSSQDTAHAWVCDSNSDVHMLCNVRGEGAGPTKWRHLAGGQMRCIVCGYQGLVCAVSSDNQLYIRTGVSYATPLGKGWARTACTVNRVAVGHQYIAAWMVNDTILFGKPNSQVRYEDFWPLVWHGMENTTPPNMSHITMDTNDTLYGVTTMGDVYHVKGIHTKDDRLEWVHLSKAPPLARRGGFLSSTLSSLLGMSRSATLFDSVVATEGCVWCLRADPLELWQLSVTDMVMGITIKHKTSWNRFKFDKSVDSIVSISSDPDDPNHLYALTKSRDAVFVLDVAGSSVTAKELPYHKRGDITLTSLSVSTLRYQEDTPPVEPPSLYPKLPKRIRLETEEEEEREDVSTSSELMSYIRGGKRNHEGYYTVAVMETGGMENMEVVGRKRKREASSSQVASPSKIPKKSNLIDGLQLVVQHKVDPVLLQNILLPDQCCHIPTQDEILQQYNFTFELEEQVLRGPLSSSPAQETPLGAKAKSKVAMATPEGNKSEVVMATPEEVDEKRSLVTGKHSTVSPAYSPTLPKSQNTVYFTARTRVTE